MIGSFESPLRRIKQLAHVTILHLFEIAELENRALNVRQRDYGLLKEGLNLRAVEEIVGHQSISYRRFICAETLQLVAP